MEKNSVFSLEQKFPGLDQKTYKPTPEGIKNNLVFYYQQRVKNSGMELIWDDHCKQILTEVYNWFGTPYKTGLLLYGGYGTGKSTILHCLNKIFLKHYIYKDYVAYYYPNEIVEKLKDNQYTNPMAHFRTVPVMLIDEAGTEPKTSLVWGDRCTPVRDIIISRYDEGRTTVIATNLDAIALEDQYGERVKDRIRQAYTCIYFGSDSYRHDPEGK